MSAYLAECYRWAVREGREVSHNAESVLVTLLTYADLATGECYPRRETIASTVYNTETPSKSQLNLISTATGELQQAGLIDEVQARYSDGHHGPNRYRLNLPRATEPNPVGQRHPVQLGTAVPSPVGHREPSPTGHREPSPTGHGGAQSSWALSIHTEVPEKDPKKISSVVDPSGGQAPPASPIEREFGNRLVGLDLSKVWLRDNECPEGWTYSEWSKSNHAVEVVGRALGVTA